MIEETKLAQRAPRYHYRSHQMCQRNPAYLPSVESFSKASAAASASLLGALSAPATTFAISACALSNACKRKTHEQEPFEGARKTKPKGTLEFEL
jgi:hypothetical protein